MFLIIVLLDDTKNAYNQLEFSNFIYSYLHNCQLTKANADNQATYCCNLSGGVALIV